MYKGGSLPYYKQTETIFCIPLSFQAMQSKQGTCKDEGGLYALSWLYFRTSL